MTYHAAIVLQKHMMSKKPIQLNRNEVVKAVKKTKSLPKRVESAMSPDPVDVSSSRGNVSKVNPGKWLRRPRLTSNSSLLDSSLRS